MLRDQIGVFALLLLTLLAPDRPPPKDAPVPDPPIPNVAGLCNWGQIEQDGRNVLVFGHPHWTASGKLDQSGAVMDLLWIENETGKPAPGRYKIEKNGRIAGKWNYEEYVAKDGLWMDDVLKPSFEER